MRKNLEQAIESMAVKLDRFENGGASSDELTASCKAVIAAAAAPPIPNGAPWTQDRVDTLKGLWQMGASATTIAEQLGGVTRNAVIGKAHRLGLEARPSPIKGDAE